MKGTSGHRLQMSTALILIVCLLGGATAFAQSSDVDGASRKYSVMAAFLYNFMSFVEWPANAQTAEGPMTIGILGRDPFGNAAEAIERKKVDGRTIRFRHFQRIEELEPTHILFIAQEEAARMPEILAVLQGRPVLTCSEHEAFTREGGMVRFFEVSEKAPDDGEQKRLRLEINETAARDANITIRSKLLRLATVVTHPAPQQ